MKYDGKMETWTSISAGIYLVQMKLFHVLDFCVFDVFSMKLTKRVKTLCPQLSPSLVVFMK